MVYWCCSVFWRRLYYMPLYATIGVHPQTKVPIEPQSTGNMDSSGCLYSFIHIHMYHHCLCLIIILPVFQLPKYYISWCSGCNAACLTWSFWCAVIISMLLVVILLSMSICGGALMVLVVRERRKRQLWAIAYRIHACVHFAVVAYNFSVHLLIHRYSHNMACLGPFTLSCFICSVYVFTSFLLMYVLLVSIKLKGNKKV